MIKMEDIYYQVDSYIMENGFATASFEEKKQLVDYGLKKYLALKINQLDRSKKLPEDKYSEVTVIDLVNLLGEMIPEDRHSQTLTHVVRYILDNASLLQGKKIKWKRENDIELADSTYFELNAHQQVIAMKTHIFPNFPQTIKFVYDVYQSPLVLEKGKQYRKKKEH